MGNSLLTMEAANLYLGSAPGDNTNSNHLILTELKLPGFDEQYVDHRPGGAPVTMEIATVFAHLECNFNLQGWTPQAAALINAWTLQQNQFTAYGAIRDRQQGTLGQGLCQITGRLGKADPQNFARGGTQQWAYTIRGIIYYKLTLTPSSGSINMNGASNDLYEWDFFQNVFNVGGVDTNAAVALAIGLTPGTAAQTAA